uniref:Putative secreted protein n=1 Tax=Ixodes ricinus TaxID=34613 RepID=A0A147BK84_IXORI
MLTWHWWDLQLWGYCLAIVLASCRKASLHFVGPLMDRHQHKSKYVCSIRSASARPCGVLAPRPLHPFIVRTSSALAVFHTNSIF